MNAIINNTTIIAAGSDSNTNNTHAKPIGAKRRRLNPSAVTASAASADNHVDLSVKVPPPNTRPTVQEKAQEMPSKAASTATARANKRRYDEAMLAAAPAR